MKVKIIPDPIEDSFRVIAMRKIVKENGQAIKYYLTNRFEWKEHDPAYIVDDIPQITDDDIPLLEAFFVELQKVFGFNEKVSMPIQKELEATKDHLNDMRAIVFKQMGIE